MKEKTLGQWLKGLCTKEGNPRAYDRYSSVDLTLTEKNGETFRKLIYSKFSDAERMTPRMMASKLTRELGCRVFEDNGRLMLRFPPCGELRGMFDAKYGAHGWLDNENVWQASGTFGKPASPTKIRLREV